MLKNILTIVFLVAAIPSIAWAQWPYGHIHSENVPRYGHPNEGPCGLPGNPNWMDPNLHVPQWPIEWQMQFVVVTNDIPQVTAETHYPSALFFTGWSSAVQPGGAGFAWDTWLIQVNPNRCAFSVNPTHGAIPYSMPYVPDDAPQVGIAEVIDGPIFPDVVGLEWWMQWVGLPQVDAAGERRLITSQIVRCWLALTTI
jgi:hypothetical protein